MRVEDAVTFHGLQGWQPCKGGYPRRKGPLLPLREDAFAGAAKVRNPPIPTMIQVHEVAHCVAQEQLKCPPAAACAVLPE